MAKYVTSSIHYIGVIDESLDKFENQYPLTQGISYNSYFIDDELTAALDTVQADRGLEWLWRLERALHGRKLDYLLVHHLEPDHSDMIATVTRMFPDVTLVMTKRAQGMLAQFADVGAVKVRTVGEGDTLELGKHRLRFVPAPMVHWPEVMVTYDETDQVLFSADAFGTFAAAQPWDDEGRRYYTNIVGKYGAAVQLLLKKLAPTPSPPFVRCTDRCCKAICRITWACTTHGAPIVPRRRACWWHTLQSTAARHRLPVTSLTCFARPASAG